MCRSGNYGERVRAPSCHPCEESNASAPSSTSERPPRGPFRVDLAELLFPAAAVTLYVERDVDRPPDPPRCDRRRDLLQGDQVLAAATDQRAEVCAKHVDAFVQRAIVERDLRLDAHESEQVPENFGAGRQVLGECRGRFLALGILTLLAPLLAFAYRVGPARDLRLVDHRFRLRRRFLLDEGDEDPGVLATDTQDVRRLTFFEHPVLDLGALLAE